MTYRPAPDARDTSPADTWWAKLCARAGYHPVGLTLAVMVQTLTLLVILSAMVLWVVVAFGGVALQGDLAYVTSRDTETGPTQ